MGRNGKSVFVARSHHGNRRVLPSGVCRHPMLAITRLAHRRHRAFFSNFVFVRSDRQQDFIPGRLSVWDLVHFDHIMVRDLLLQLKLASKRFCRDFYVIVFFCTDRCFDVYVCRFTKPICKKIKVVLRRCVTSKRSCRGDVPPNRPRYLLVHFSKFIIIDKTILILTELLKPISKTC